MILLLLGCPATHPPSEGVEVAEVALPAASAAHPGEIVFLDRDDGATHTERADSVPASIAWVEREGVRIPVVRIETSTASGAREIFRYGPTGELLEVTRGGAGGR